MIYLHIYICRYISLKYIGKYVEITFMKYHQWPLILFLLKADKLLSKSKETNTFHFLFRTRNNKWSLIYNCFDIKKGTKCIEYWDVVYQKRFYDRETIAALNYNKCLSYPLSFNATQIINPFLKLRISANHDKVEELLANDEILLKRIVSL